MIFNCGPAAKGKTSIPRTTRSSNSKFRETSDAAEANGLADMEWAWNILGELCTACFVSFTADDGLAASKLADGLHVDQKAKP